MSYVNKNSLLFQLEELVKKDIQNKQSYLPDSFYEEQRKVLEIFEKRIFLEKIIDESISFNRKLQFQTVSKNLFLIKNAEDLIDVFKLRSDVYINYGYNNEFPDMIEGLSFDEYDSHSAIIFYKNKEEKITGSVRLIIGNENKKTPTENKVCFKELKQNDSLIAEISKLVVNSRRNGLALEFKYLMQGAYTLFSQNNINTVISAIKTSDLKLYEKLGTVEIIKELTSYGKIMEPFSVISYDTDSVTKFSKKAILK